MPINHLNMGNSSCSKSFQSKSYNFSYYLIVILLLLLDGSPFFITKVRQEFWLIIFVLIFLNNVIKGRRILTTSISLVLISVWVLILIQAILYGRMSLAGIYLPLFYFYTPYLVYTLMGLHYFKYLYNVIFFIAIYTSLIYLLQIFSPAFNEFIMGLFDSVFPYSWADWPRTILIYSIPRDSGFLFTRNSGIFYEPGAYSVYLMLAIVINTFHTNSPLNRRNIFLMVVLISTISTAGYFMLFAFLSYAVIKLKISILLKPLFILAFIYLALIVYQNSDFLEQKVDTHINAESKLVEQNKVGQRGRYYSLGMAFKSIGDAPFTGNGILALSSKEQETVFAGGYGFPGLLSRFGLIFGLLYIWYNLKGFFVLSDILKGPKFFAVSAIIIVNIGLLTQALYFSTPFVYFFIVGFILKKHLSSLT